MPNQRAVACRLIAIGQQTPFRQTNNQLRKGLGFSPKNAHAFCEGRVIRWRRHSPKSPKIQASLLMAGAGGIANRYARVRARERETFPVGNIG